MPWSSSCKVAPRKTCLKIGKLTICGKLVSQVPPSPILQIKVDVDVVWHTLSGRHVHWHKWLSHTLPNSQRFPPYNAFVGDISTRGRYRQLSEFLLLFEKHHSLLKRHSECLHVTGEMIRLIFVPIYTSSCVGADMCGSGYSLSASFL